MYTSLWKRAANKIHHHAADLQDIVSLHLSHCHSHTACWLSAAAFKVCCL